MHDEQIILRTPRVGRGDANLEWKCVEPGDAIVSEQGRGVAKLGIITAGSPSVDEIDIGIAPDSCQVSLTCDVHDFVRSWTNNAEISRDRDEFERATAVDIVEHRLECEIEPVDVGHDGDAHL